MSFDFPTAESPRRMIFTSASSELGGGGEEGIWRGGGAERRGADFGDFEGLGEREWGIERKREEG